jgi:hypothetical protein
MRYLSSSSSQIVFLFVFLFASLFFANQAWAQVAISTQSSTTTPDPTAVLLLVGDGSQGLIIPIVTNKSAASQKKGMVVFDDSDKKVYFNNGSGWIEVGGGSGSGVKGIRIQGNVVTVDNTSPASFSLAQTAPTVNGQLLMWDATLNSTAGGWTSSKNTAPATGQVLKWNGTSWEPGTDNAGSTPALPNNQIFVGNASNVATSVSMSQDAAINNTGALTIATGAINSTKILDGTIADADVSASAGIAGSKIDPTFTVGVAAPSLKITGGGTSINGQAYTWPAVAPLANTFLKSDALGNLSWATAGSSFTTANVIPKGAVGGLTSSRIADDGTSIGVGVTPLQRFHIGLAATTIGLGLNQQNGLRLSNGNNASNGFELLLGGPLNSNSAYLWNWEVGTLALGTNNIEHILLDGIGNVGIGTGTGGPQAKLDVVGKIRMSDGNEAAGKVLTSDANGLGTWQPAGGGSGFSTNNSIPKGNGSTLVASTITDDGSTVEITANSPKLSLKSTSAVSTSAASSLEFTNALNGLIGSISDTGSSDHLQISSFSQGLLFNTNFANRMAIDNNGNVGIGTISPVNRLDVEGGIAIGSTYSGANGAPANGAIIEGNVGIGTNGPSDNLHVREDVDGTAGITLQNNSTGQFSNERISFNNENGGLAGIQMNDVTSVTGASMSIFNNRPSGTMRLSTGGVVRMAIMNNGDVGIGTISPNADLQLANTLGNRRFVLFESANNDHQYYGLGVNGGEFRYQIANNTGAAHRFYAGTSASTSLLQMSIGQNGNVSIAGSLSKGSGTFKIDHPQDPENKYLYHSFVESPDMMNVYNGNITTDAKGDAVISLPNYFEALNKDFRYQLTVIGTFAQAIVMKEVEANQFTIKTDKPNVKVSWQVTGIRKDPFAEKNRVVPEVEKTGSEKGKFLHPEAYGLPLDRSINYEPKKENN